MKKLVTEGSFLNLLIVPGFIKPGQLCMGLFPSVQVLWGEVLMNHFPPVLKKKESGNQLMHTNSTLLGPRSVHSCSASWDDCGWEFSDVCELISQMCSHTIPGQHSQHTLTLLGQECMHTCMSCNLPFALLAERLGLLCATVENRYQSKSAQNELTLEKKILPPFLPGVEPATWSWVWCSTTQLYTPPRSITHPDSCLWDLVITEDNFVQLCHYIRVWYVSRPYKNNIRPVLSAHPSTWQSCINFDSQEKCETM